MTFNGLFIIQLGALKTAPEHVDVIAIPFFACPDGMLVEGTIINVGLKDKSIETLELTVFGHPIYYKGWEIMVEIHSQDVLQVAYDYLKIQGRGTIDDRRLVALEPFYFS